MCRLFKGYHSSMDDFRDWKVTMFESPLINPVDESLPPQMFRKEMRDYIHKFRVHVEGSTYRLYSSGNCSQMEIGRLWHKLLSLIT